ncbi:MAG: hypothetical protein WBF66_04995 [Dehalococcoidia bacterium]
MYRALGHLKVAPGPDRNRSADSRQAGGATRAPVLALDSSSVPRGGQAKRLDAVFWASVIASTLLLIWSTLSTRIDNVDVGVLSMARLLPPTYWAGFALLLASTIIWYFGGETKAFHFLLVALWMGYVFLGPELMEAHPRAISSYGQAWGIGYVLEGREREFLYFPWLGFHFAFAAVSELTDIGYLAMIRVGSLVMYLTLALGAICFFGRVLPDKRSILLATLVTLAMFAVLGVGFTPHQMAFVLMLFAFSFLASLDAFPVVNRLLLIGIFCAILITHGLSALLVVYVAAMAALARWRPSAFGRWSPSTASLSLLFAILFVGWLLYSSDFWFADAVRAFRDTVLREPSAFTSPFGHASPAGAGRAEVALLNLAFLAVLLVWLLSVVARRGFWTGLRRDRLFPLLVVSGLPVLIMGTGSFTYEGFMRVFLYAIPFLAWFLARESVASRSAAAFLVLLLGLGFFVLYAREFEELPTSQQFAGANFLVDAAGPNASVIQGDCLPPGAIANTIDAPEMSCAYPNPSEPQLEQVPDASEFTFGVLSDIGERTASFSFAFGKPWWESLRDSVQGESFAKIYSNGGYDVFARQPPQDERSQEEVSVAPAIGAQDR